MTNQKPQPLESQIVDLLESEHRMLLAADFDMLKSVTEKKEALVSMLTARAEQDTPALTSEIQRKAKHNAQLYEAAILGLKLATNRISELKTTLGELKTYDDRGLVTTSTSNRSSVSVKA